MWDLIRAKPAPPRFGEGKVTPEDHASVFSRVLFVWLDKLVWAGYTRPLQKDDLWVLPERDLVENVSGAFEERFYSRCKAEKRPPHIRSKETTGGKDVKQDESLVFAFYEMFKFKWWATGILKLAADTLTTTAPLVNKVLLTWLVDSFLAARVPESTLSQLGIATPRGIGFGIGIAFALFAMEQSSSLLDNQYQQITMKIGMNMRTAVVASVYRKALRLSGRSRQLHTVGHIITLISKDATSFDHMAMYMHFLWVSPLQICIGIGLLIGQLGYSALAGLGVLVVAMPLMGVLLQILVKSQEKRSRWTDKRTQLTSEIIQGIRLIKFYAWERFYEDRVSELRQRELKAIRNFMIAGAAALALFTFLPIGSTIMSFITYALTGHDLNVAIIFTSLQLFNVIQGPLLLFSAVLSALAQLKVSMNRLSKFLLAEELEEPFTIDDGIKNAIEVDASFVWEAQKKDESPDSKDNGYGKKGAEAKRTDKTGKKNSGKQGSLSKDVEKDNDSESLPSSVKDIQKDAEKVVEYEESFKLEKLRFDISKGAFVCIVGHIGSGKSSILEALVGEMRRTEGSVKFSGQLAYVPQKPWILNQTLRNNVIFGQTEDEDRYRAVIRACALEQDIESLTHGEQTEIGEKGINLSGGQKARVALARAIYSDCSIVLLDDVLSAVDASTGNHLLENCLLSGPLADKTRVLATHSLHVLSSADYIYVVDNGEIVERGTYETLAQNSSKFASLVAEHSGQRGVNPSEQLKQRLDKQDVDPEKKEIKDTLMQIEERQVGAVQFSVYSRYVKSAGGSGWWIYIIIVLILVQGTQVVLSLFLGWWTSQSIHGFKQGHYIALYAALGAAQALWSFLLALVFLFIGLKASTKLFRGALHSLLESPITYFDTTPIGRIISRLSKDQDTIDTELSIPAINLLTAFASVFGTIALVAYTFPYLTLIFIPLTILYYVASVFYRATSVEVKRLDAILRSSVYATVTESLTGLSTIRAFRRQNRAIGDADHGMNIQNRAYYITISVQRWLAVRLDFFGNILILGIGLFAAGFRTKVDPSKVGVVLSYTLQITAQLAQMVTLFAMNEQNMNSVERILTYNELPPEEGLSTHSEAPDPSWPAFGNMIFEKVSFAYRKGLPLVLQDVSFSVSAGQKVAVCGRTGAGKSSLVQALLRITSPQEGRVVIDGVDIETINVQTLRSRIALVPQESPLFLGTIRQNIDPKGSLTDAELISILQRCSLLPAKGVPDPTAEEKFSLDSKVGDEGSNYSAGEKQLIALARALVKDSRIIVLDEATSSVDSETDTQIQRTIRNEFAERTLLCIAHRLGTIVSYDKVLVLDEGEIAETGSVLELFENDGSIFRSLCNEAGLSRDDIIRLRKDNP